jgi:hypothetical protein
MDSKEFLEWTKEKKRAQVLKDLPTERKACIKLYCTPVFVGSVIYFSLYFVAALASGLAVASIQYLSDTPTFIVQCDFRKNPITGKLNNLDVIDMSEIRFGIWGPCYTDYKNRLTCLPISKFSGWDTIITSGNISQVIVPTSWSVGLKFVIFYGFFTFVTFIMGYFGRFMKFRNWVWAPGCAVATTGGMILMGEIFYSSIKGKMQIFGPQVRIVRGSALKWLPYAIAALSVGSFIQYFVGQVKRTEKKKEAEEKKKKANEEKLKDPYIMFGDF